MIDTPSGARQGLGLEAQRAPCGVHGAHDGEERSKTMLACQAQPGRVSGRRRSAHPHTHCVWRAAQRVEERRRPRHVQADQDRRARPCGRGHLPRDSSN